MGLLLLLIRLGLAGVLIVSGIAKLGDRAGTRESYEAFRLPTRFAPAVAMALPVVELAVSTALVPGTPVPVSAGLAAALFLTFAIVVTRSVLHDDQVECNCFGQLSAAPVTWRTVARNALLTLLALVVWRHALASDALAPWGGDILGSLVCLVAPGGLAALIQLRVRAAAPQTTAPGESSHLDRPLPALPVDPVGDAPRELATLARRTPLVIILSDPHCRPCARLMPEVARWQREYGAWLQVAVVTRGDTAAAEATVHEHGLANLYLQHDQAASEALGVIGTPSAVLVDTGGQLQGPVARGSAAVADLIAGLVPSTAGDAKEPVRLPSRIGQLVPMTRVADLDGAQKFVGGPSTAGQLLIFWDPTNPACQAMRNDLTALERSWPATAPELVVVSRGTPESNRRQSLRSLVVLDESFVLGHAAGATGTPSAVLLSSSGRIAAELATTAPEILALARAHEPSIPAPAR
jgi:uncharacterized membrane protein YphA (DoxX/SURF4 family)